MRKNVRSCKISHFRGCLNDYTDARVLGKCRPSFQGPKSREIHEQQREDLQVQHNHFSTAEYLGAVLEDGKLLFPAFVSSRVVPSCKNTRWFYLDANAATVRYWRQHGEGYLRR